MSEATISFMKRGTRTGTSPPGAPASAQDATLVRPGGVRAGSGLEPQYSGGR